MVAKSGVVYGGQKGWYDNDARSFGNDGTGTHGKLLLHNSQRRMDVSYGINKDGSVNGTRGLWSVPSSYGILAICAHLVRIEPD